MKRIEKGFVIVEGLIILLALGLVSFGGYYVWHKNHKTKPAPSAVANPYAGWSTYSNPKWGVSFKYPPQWVVDTADESETLSLTVSPISNSQLQANQNNLSQYNNDLGVAVVVTPQAEGTYQTTTGPVMGELNSKGVNYPLIGYKSNNEVVNVELYTCKTTTNCDNEAPTSGGGYINVTISSDGNSQAGGPSTVPINTNSAEYHTTDLLVKSLLF